VSGIRARTLILLATLLASLAVSVPATASAATPRAVPHRLQVTLSLRPRHPHLLKRMAISATAQSPMTPAMMRALFLPSRRQLARVRATMHRAGLRYHSRRALSVTFTGNAAAVRRAFGVGVRASRRADGSLALRPSARPRLPLAIAGDVRDVEGIDTRVRLHPAGTVPAGAAHPACPGARDAAPYLPSQLASARGYGHGALIARGYDGGGERIAVVEFSNYRRGDIDAYQRCFGLDVPITDRMVGSGTSSRAGSDEVELDIETAISAAPGLGGVDVYIARPTATTASAVNAIVADAQETGVRIISDSWGVCEPALSPLRAAATNDALQLAAVSGITFLAASGDSGSFDCAGFPVLAVDDPAAQPFATGVGGSDLHLNVRGAGHEVTWDDRFGAGGGGLSRFWPRPTWQAGPGVIGEFSDGSRQVPDISLHASPHPSGHVIYCTTFACAGRGWASVGGTSAAAPLMAGIVADMNDYSRAHGGRRLGFADPFLYRQLARGRGLRDIVLGDNHLDGSGRYAAGPGYDMASGVGAPRAVRLAAALARYRPSLQPPAATHLTAAPSRDVVLRFGRRLRLHGRLTGAGGAPIAGVRVIVQGIDLLGVREWRRTTSAGGEWHLTFRRQIVRRTRWRAVYLGSEHRAPSISPAHTIYVIPPLRAWLGAQRIAAGARVRLHGATLPALAGRPLAAELRRPGGRWHRIGPVQVRESGRAVRTLTFTTPGRYRLRWRYHGSRRGQWLSARSPAVTLVVG